MTDIAKTFSLAQKLISLRQFDKAIKDLRLITVLSPDHAEAHRLAAAVYLQHLDRPDLSIEHLTAIVRLKPEDPVALANLCGVLIILGRSGEAIGPLREGLKKFPTHLNLRDNLLAALTESGRSAEAITFGSQLLSEDPDNTFARQNLATAFQSVGEIAQAQAVIRAWRGGMSLRALAQRATLHNYLESDETPQSRSDHLAFGASFGRPPVADSAVKPSAHPDARPSRIAFISPDLRRHSVASFIEPLLFRLPSPQCKVFVFMTSPVEDETTLRLRKAPVQWRTTPNLSPRDLADMIAKDSPDVVIELSGLTLGHSLPALSLRPAPVLMTYLGYPNTTGCPFVDYRIVDAQTDPSGSTSPCVEKLLRLDRCFLCYQPPVDAPDPAAPSSQAPFTFGCMGSAQKYSPAVLDLWHLVLQAVPSSRLLLKSAGVDDPESIDLLRRRLERAGLPLDRVTFLPATRSLAAHLETYNNIDLSLDTYPYHGTTTTCESLLMGVPVLALAGHTHASRVGVSLLSTVGLGNFVTRSTAEYVDAAIAFHAKYSRTVDARRQLRQALLASPLCDAPGFAARFLHAVRGTIAVAAP